MSAAPRITLLTDFGTADGYVAAMRGMIARIAPDVVVDDVSHDIAPGDVVAAAWAVGNYWRRYPEGTVHVVVVDPGVGTTRRALAAEAAGRLLVAPDNGALSHALRDGRARVASIENERYRESVVSATFHGRDVFAPAGAHLARGLPLDELGPAVSDPVLLPILDPKREGGAVRGRIIHIDRFGNLITNIPADWVSTGAHVRIGASDVGPVRRTYADVATGRGVALIGSSGYLEISVRDGNAAERLWQRRGSEVVVEAPR